MTTFTSRAFEKVFNRVFSDTSSFLKFFQNSGCYLEDICLEPVDKLPPKERTILYNENWMLRIILDWLTTNSKLESLIPILPKSKWYSEALLASAFLPRYRGCIFR